MPTIINNPPNTSSTNSGDSSVFGILMFLVVVAAGAYLLIVYGLPNFRATEPNTTNINVEMPDVPAPTVTPSQNTTPQPEQ